MMTATYSPEDNKLRLYSSGRLDSDAFARVKAAGFRWAPKQELFVAPAWSPEREDLLVELCGEVGDEDTSLADRQAERAERFEDYSASRLEDAERAHKAVASIADGIPTGQPILVGHHSEKRARKDAEKIQAGMDRAVKAWKTSKYWTDRAASALAHAKYKELPGVRARRIKGIEADLRRLERARKEAGMNLVLWENCPDMAKAKTIAGYTPAGWLPCCKHPELADSWLHPSNVLPLDERNEYEKAKYPTWTLEQVKERAREYYTPRALPCRWTEHYENRLAYERAMLAEGGGLVGAQFDYQVGGRVLRRGEWLLIVKVNRRNGELQSVSVSGHWGSTVGLDEIKGYEPPSDPEAAGKIKKALDKGPLCNYDGPGFKHMTTEEYKKHHWSDRSYTEVVAATETAAKHRVRTHNGAKWSQVRVFLTDAPVKLPPKPEATPNAPDVDPIEWKATKVPYPAYGVTTCSACGRPGHGADDDACPKNPTAEKFKALERVAEAGVQVVSAPQLFPTPPDLARKLVALAGLWDGCSVLEPSAGTGNLLRAIYDTEATPGEVFAVEMSQGLADRLETGFPTVPVRCADFLMVSPEAIGTFDRVVMNPPFGGAQDIEHIRHALKFLKPGGMVVAICANGPRQREAFRDIAEHWEDLPAGSFKDSGTNVNAAIVVLGGAT